METIIRFDKVSFTFDDLKALLDDVSFSVRKGMKIALMGQNGAGKSTIFKLMTQSLKPESGTISMDKRLTVATAQQVIPEKDKKLNIEEYFKKDWVGEIYELRSKISAILEVVNLSVPHDKPIQSFSGGQQARLLLASALIQSPDLLLLDEPTNNLDYAGIQHLTDFLIDYKKSCIVISHDAEFLNAFTQGVLYLDSYTKKVDNYAGNYLDVVRDIADRIEKENRLNAQRERVIQENKEKANFFANKGGKMRNVAKKMREKIEDLEDDIVDVRKEDKTIRHFVIPAQKNESNEPLIINSFTVMQNYKLTTKTSHIFLTNDNHLLIIGPNGVGKSTLIKSMVDGTVEGFKIPRGIRVGYYRQDFSNLESESTVYDSLFKALQESGENVNEGYLRSVASGFLINSDLIKSKIGDLSEGQKGLLCFACLVLQKPGLLILDEPTNHINFRHLPVIAEALSNYKGLMILISHANEFVSQVRIDEILDLEK